MDRAALFGKMVEDNIRAKQELGRTPEPHEVTDGEANVAQYNRVLNTNMTANYATSLDLIHRSSSDRRQTALDLCSGPGHLTTRLATDLGYKQVVGIDFSLPMVNVAKENAAGAVHFEHGDVLNMKYAEASFDLVSWTNAAHHLAALSDVAHVLKTCDTLARPDGTVVLTDVGRLKTRDVTERFVQLAGEEFLQLGMKDMFDDFRNSMFAAWTADELAACVPRETKREWILMAPLGLTNYVALFGLPVGRHELFVRESLDWSTRDLLKSPQAKSDWHVLKQIVAGAEYRMLGGRNAA